MVSTTSPTVNYSDLLLQEGKTAGYTTARFVSARVLGVSVWSSNQLNSTTFTDSSVGLWLREGPGTDAMAPVGYDVGAVGIGQANVKALAGEWLSSAWDGGTTAFMSVTDGFGATLTEAFSGIVIEVTAAFR